MYVDMHNKNLYLHKIICQKCVIEHLRFKVYGSFEYIICCCNIFHDNCVVESVHYNAYGTQDTCLPEH